MTFNVKEYMPHVFRNIRQHFGIDEDSYKCSFSKIQPVTVEQSGRSGAVFYLTNDHRYYVKSMSCEEVNLMHKIMYSYHTHISDTQAQTLLPQYLGMYRIKLGSKTTNFLVVRNVFSTQKIVHTKYDLKGSSHGRMATQFEKQKKVPTLKDMDFRWEGRKLCVGDEMKNIFMDKLKHDVQLLSSLRLMDYSLIVGIHECSPVTHEELPSDMNPEYNPEFYAVKGLMSTNGKQCIYYMGIIDVLSYYGSSKMTAHAAKACVYGSRAGLSTVNPHVYATRFLNFLESSLA